jgi:acyl-CoA synthetase (AMP-forming)/AMP-acid ligase II
VAGFNLADLFERVADAVPERTAVVAGADRCTYAELDERATRVAHLLTDGAAGGVATGPGAHVGLCLELILGCYKARLVPVNVNWRYTDDELAYVAADGDLVQVWRDDDVAPPAYDARVASASPARDFAERSGDDHYVLYTGGTTGRPKGVVWRQEDIFFGALGGGNPGGPPITEPEQIRASVVQNPAQRLRPFLPPDDPGPEQFVALALGPLVHASGQWSALGTLLGGGRVVLYTDAHIDMDVVLELIARERVNALNLVGDTSARPLVATLARDPARYDVSSVRLLGSGGTMLSADTKVELLRLLPNVLAIVEGIGSSESPAQAVALTTRDSAAPTSLAFSAKAETMVVDDDLRPIPNGSGRAGRLATRGRVPLGYYKDPEKSTRTFVEIDGARWSLPGDMATIDADGTVHLLGRGSQCINTGGEKVFPEEVEAVLKLAPAVADAVVLGAPDDRFGQRVVAIVTASGELAPSLAALQAHCRAHLAGYKVPRALYVVDDVERTVAGKVDYTWARAVVDGS